MRIPSAFRDRKPIELQLTPMIDCVFLLMIYFLWSSSFGVSELSLASTLSAKSRPATGPANANEPPPPEADFDNVIVRVVLAGDRPAWFVNDSPLDSLTSLRETLSTIARIKADAPVVLDPAPGVPLGDVIDVFDLSRLVGFQRIQFATSDSGPAR